MPDSEAGERSQMWLGSQFISGCIETWLVACLVWKPKLPRERDPEREPERVRDLPDVVSPHPQGDRLVEEGRRA